MALSKFDPQAYEREVAAKLGLLLESQGIDPANTPKYASYESDGAAPSSGGGQLLSMLGSQGLKYGAKKAASSLGLTGGGEAAAQVGSQLAQTAAQNAAWNAAGTAATEQAAAQALGQQAGTQLAGQTGMSSLGSYVPPALALYVIGKGIYGSLKHKNRDKYKDEFLRAEKLRQSGVDWQFNTEMPTKGRSREELVAEELAKQSRGEWGNPTFAQSRDVKDLKPEDIWGYSVFGEKYGNDWLGKFSEDQRKQIAQKYLDEGLVREHASTLDLDTARDSMYRANDPTLYGKAMKYAEEDAKLARIAEFVSNIDQQGGAEPTPLAQPSLDERIAAYMNKFNTGNRNFRDMGELGKPPSYLTGGV
jgi:hypothetical protein